MVTAVYNLTGRWKKERSTYEHHHNLNDAQEEP